jgi:hypothetical protein
VHSAQKLMSCSAEDEIWHPTDVLSHSEFKKWGAQGSLHIYSQARDIHFHRSRKLCAIAKGKKNGCERQRSFCGRVLQKIIRRTPKREIQLAAVSIRYVRVVFYSLLTLHCFGQQKCLYIHLVSGKKHQKRERIICGSVRAESEISAFFKGTCTVNA